MVITGMGVLTFFGGWKNWMSQFCEVMIRHCETRDPIFRIPKGSYLSVPDTVGDITDTPATQVTRPGSNLVDAGVGELNDSAVVVPALTEIS